MQLCSLIGAQHTPGVCQNLKFKCSPIQNPGSPEATSPYAPSGGVEEGAGLGRIVETLANPNEKNKVRPHAFLSEPGSISRHVNTVPGALARLPSAMVWLCVVINKPQSAHGHGQGRIL